LRKANPFPLTWNFPVVVSTAVLFIDSEG
jgi:hypothetical protein